MPARSSPSMRTEASALKPPDPCQVAGLEVDRLVEADRSIGPPGEDAVEDDMADALAFV